MSKKKDSTCAYAKHELVFAKIRGYPWWPGVIGRVNLKTYENGEKKYEVLVNFIGDDSHSIVSEDKLKKYTKQEVDLKNKKSKKLMESIVIANRIFAGLLSYEDWYKLNRKKQKHAKKQKGNRKGSTKIDESEEENSSDSSSIDSSNTSMEEIEEDDDDDQEEEEEVGDEEEHEEFEGDLDEQAVKHNGEEAEEEVEIFEDTSMALEVSDNQFGSNIASKPLSKSTRTSTNTKGKKMNISKMTASTTTQKKSANRQYKNKGIQSLGNKALSQPYQESADHSNNQKKKPPTNFKSKEDSDLLINKQVEEFSKIFHFGMEQIISNGSSSTTCSLMQSKYKNNDDTSTKEFTLLSKNVSSTSASLSGGLAAPAIISGGGTSVAASHKNYEISAQTVIETEDDEEEEIGAPNDISKSGQKESESEKLTQANLIYSQEIESMKGGKSTPRMNGKKQQINSRTAKKASSNVKSENLAIDKEGETELLEGNNLHLQVPPIQKKSISKTTKAQIKKTDQSNEMQQIINNTPKLTGKSGNIYSTLNPYSPTSQSLETPDNRVHQQTCWNFDMDLSSEFNSVFTSKNGAANQLKSMQTILDKIMNAKPNMSNILAILNTSNGNMLTRARQILFDRSQQAGSSKNIPRMLEQFDNLIQLLQETLVKKFFNQEAAFGTLCGEERESKQTDISSPDPLKQKAQDHLDCSPIELEKHSLESGHHQISLTDEQKQMRKRICSKIIKPLQRILKDQAIVQNLSRSTENMILQSDPTMGVDYKTACRNFITLISSNEFSTTVPLVENYIISGNPTHLYLLSKRQLYIWDGSEKRSIELISPFEFQTQHQSLLGESTFTIRNDLNSNNASAIAIEEEYKQSLIRTNKNSSAENTPVFNQEALATTLQTACSSDNHVYDDIPKAKVDICSFSSTFNETTNGHSTQILAIKDFSSSTASSSSPS